MSIMFGFAIGLVVGWNFLSQPKFIKTLLDNLLNK